MKETSKVVALIPLLAIHVAREFEPITLTASAECRSKKKTTANIRSDEEKKDRMPLCVRLGRERSMISSFLNGFIYVRLNRGIEEVWTQISLKGEGENIKLFFGRVKWEGNAERGDFIDGEETEEWEEGGKDYGEVIMPTRPFLLFRGILKGEREMAELQVIFCARGAGLLLCCTLYFNLWNVSRVDSPDTGFQTNFWRTPSPASLLFTPDWLAS